MEAKNKTAHEIAYAVYEKNQPIDWGWIRHVKRTSTDKELLEFCRTNIDGNVSGDISKHKLTRAANILKNRLF